MPWVRCGLAAGWARGDPAAPLTPLSWQRCISSSSTAALSAEPSCLLNKGREVICFKNNLPKMGRGGMNGLFLA